MNHQLRSFFVFAIIESYYEPSVVTYAVSTQFSCAGPNRVSINIVSALLILTFINLASFLWDKGKQWRPRPDATERGVWSGSPLFAYRMLYQNLNKNENYHPNNH